VTRWGALAGLGILALLLAAPAPAETKGKAAAAPPPRGEAVVSLPDTWYAQVLAHSDAGLNVTDFWSKGSKLRAETVVAGRRIVTLVNGDTYYAYDRLDGTGVAIARAESAMRQDAKRVRPFGNELAVLLRQGAEHVDREKLGGRVVDHYRVTDTIGKRQLWVTADPFALPVRLEIFMRSNGSTVQTDYLNWLHGLPIADSFFEPEPTLILKHMSSQEYLTTSPEGGKLGPVPVLYSDLLVGR
jgi:hypothetical protein